MRQVKSGGGWQAIRYTLKKSREVGGLRKLWKAMRTKNACKTCALGMGGQQGGMVNELGSFPEVCKKSLQAMSADMQGAIGSEFWKTHTVSHLRELSPRALESCGRLVEPLLHVRGESGYRPINWNEALTRVTDKLTKTLPDETFWYFSGRSSNEAGFLLQLFARMYGTNHINNCSYYCHQASGVGLTSSVGSGTATIVLDDVESADLVFVIGGNPPSNHPRLMTTLKNVRRRGGEVIVINPVREAGLVNFRVPSDPWSLLFGTKIATHYVQPHIGGDLALLSGIAKRVDERGACDEAFLSKCCEGSDAYLAHLRAIPWQEIEERSGVSRDQIDDIADRYGSAKNVIFSWTMGITHHAHGVQNVQAIANLAMLRGMLGRPKAGLMPIRGHSNVQGVGSVGATPKLKGAIQDRLEKELDITLPKSEGLDTLGCMEAAHSNKMRFGFCLGGNLYGSNPDQHFASEALSRLDMLVYVSTTMNTGHAHGLASETIILPVLARDEEPHATTQESMFNYVRLSDGGPPRHVGPRSEVDVISQLASRTLGRSTPVDWKVMGTPANIRNVIAQVVPGFRKLSRIEQTKDEFQIEGRTFHEPRFPTSSGRAMLHCHQLPELCGGSGQLRTDDRSQRGSIQYGGLRGGGHLSWARSSRRHSHEPKRYGTFGTASRPTCHRHQQGWQPQWDFGTRVSRYPRRKRPDVFSRGEFIGSARPRSDVQDASL